VELAEFVWLIGRSVRAKLFSAKCLAAQCVTEFTYCRHCWFWDPI